MFSLTVAQLDIGARRFSESRHQPRRGRGGATTRATPFSTRR